MDVATEPALQPLVVFIPAFERCIVRQQDLLAEFTKAAAKVTGRVLFLAGHASEPGKKDRASVGGMLFSRALMDMAVLDSMGSGEKGGGGNGGSNYKPSVPGLLAKEISNVVWLNPPTQAKELDKWERDIRRDTTVWWSGTSRP